MVSQTGEIRLFEALELRAEYEARIGTIRECLPGALRRLPAGAGPDGRDGVFDPLRLREALQELEERRDALDDAIQVANAAYGVTFKGRRMTLGQAFELRGVLSREMGGLQRRVVVAAQDAVDRRETPSQLLETAACPACVRQLDEARRTFRALNRLLWMATVDASVAYGDAR